jgi:hypothetical protein
MPTCGGCSEIITALYPLLSSSFLKASFFSQDTVKPKTMIDNTKLKIEINFFIRDTP